MKILLASPFFSRHWDSGHFWARALSNLGHTLSLWDYRLQSERPEVEFDLAVVLKGSPQVAQQLWERHTLGAKLTCYWPDAFGRDPENEAAFLLYDRVFTPVRPTPEGMVWLPTGYDPDIHRPIPGNRPFDTVFVGTATPRKKQFLEVIQPQRVFGNGWGPNISPVYLWNLVEVLSVYKVAVNIHRDDVGVTRRLFEFMACCFTVTDIVPGVEEVLGKELAVKVGFKTPEEGKEKVEYFVSHSEEREELWRAEREVIKPYTYGAVARRMLERIYAR